MILNRLLLACLTAYFCTSLYANNPFQLDRTKGVVSKININKQFQSSGKIHPFRSAQPIICLSINGLIKKECEDYLVRIILTDEKGDEYLALESYELINNSPEFLLENYCEETAMLGGIVPKEMKIVVENASLEIKSIEYIEAEQGSCFDEKSLIQEIRDIRKEQVSRTIEKINTYNREHKKLWLASETGLSLLPWKERKRVMGIKNDNCYTWGFEYYGGGIIDIGFPNRTNIDRKIRQRSTDSTFVSSYDWRNRHGINWMTPVKDQITNGACWAFTAIGVVEAMANLYYNMKIDLDLSEQEVVSCTDNSIGTIQNGGWSWKALGWIADNGVFNEEFFPYSNIDKPCSNTGIITEHVYINDTVPVVDYFNNTDTVKKYLIKKGPMASGIRYWKYNQNTHTYDDDGGHAMVLTGFNEIVEDSIIGLFSKDIISNNFQVPSNSNLVGYNYWIFKNSLANGHLNSHNGYAYVYFYDDDCFRMPYYVEPPITSLRYSYSDIVCIDRDGDGYYTWGLGPKPAHCPSWVPDEADGDDSNINYGPLDDYGNLVALTAGYTVKSSVTYSYNNPIPIPYQFGIVNGGTLTITGTMILMENSRIRVCEGGILIVDGGTIQNADITMVPGCTVILRNNGKINMASGKTFEAPLGATITIESGEINQ